MATLEELTTPLTRDEIEASIYAAIEARGVSTTSWKPGAITRTIITGVAIVLRGFSVLQAEIAKSGFLEFAAAAWLTVLAKLVYDVDRNEGTFASGTLTLDNTGGGVFSFGVGDVIARNPTTGRTYRNTAAFSLAAFQVGVDVAFEAVELGSQSNAAPGAISAFETALTGVTVTNAAAFVGEDAEDDAALKVRCLAKTGTLSPNGPPDAYRFFALSARTTTGALAGVTRVTTVPDGTGLVNVYVASASGPVLGTVGDPSTALGAVDQSIQTLVVPEGVTADVQSATALAIAPTYELWVRNTIGLTTLEIQNLIASALATWLSQQPIGGSRKVAGGGFVFLDALQAVIAEAVGKEHFIDVDVTAPAGDTAVAASEAPTLGTITVTNIHLVGL